MPVPTYYYNTQLRQYLLQTAAIFSGLQVRYGKDRDGNRIMKNVPIHYGSMDKVTASIIAGHTTNKPVEIPLMSLYMAGIELAPERRKGISVVDRRVHMAEGGVFPDDVKVAYRVMPIPYNLNVDLYLIASNTDQLHQILEQILMMFDPIVQIQTSDKEFDWTKLTHVELMGINNDENFPTGPDKRVISWTLNFQVPIWLSPPMKLKDDIVKKVTVQVYDASVGGLHLNEFDSNGNLVPWDHLMDEIIIP